jgi:hypothetical protein
MVRTRLEQLAQNAGMGLHEFVKGFHEASVRRNPAEPCHISDRQAKRWLAGTSGDPRILAARVLEHWWGEPASTLLGPPTAEVQQVRVTPEEVIMNAGRESVEHAISASAVLDTTVLENLQAETYRLARAYLVKSPIQITLDLIRLRNTIYTQLDRTSKPAQQAELYLLAGLTCGLLSSVSWDLGQTDVAEEQARATYTYGSVIDHPSVQAYGRALQVTVAFWSGRPREAAAIAESALVSAPGGVTRVRLHSVHARALAMIGARDEAERALQLAADELESSALDPFVDEIGGELRFDRSRMLLCAGAAFVALGDGDQAEKHAAGALQLFAQEPAGSRWEAGELGARVDLGTARILKGDLAGAEETLESVFEVSPDLRTEALNRRLLNLARMLGHAPYRKAVEAKRLGEHIEDFARDSLATSTPRLAIS